MAEKDEGRRRLLIAVSLVVGVSARFLLPRFGFNYDAASYWIVSDILRRGGNVYAETTRYNYGPVWFLILGSIRRLADLAGDPQSAFRIGIVTVLTIADLAIAGLLHRAFGWRAALLFFLNPVSVIITGYHNQFDNVAIALGFASAVVAERAAREGDGRLHIASLCLLGVSLSTKHIFFVLPLWLAFREARWRERVLAAGLPVLIFALAFLPFSRLGWSGILHNVLLYRSFSNGLLIRVLAQITPALPPALPLIIGLSATGWLIRRRPLVETLLVYLVVLVVLSPAMTNQYLAIPMATVAVAMNPAYGLYLVAAVLLLLSNEDGLGLSLFTRMGGTWQALDGRTGYDVPVLLLAAGLRWQMRGWRRNVAQAPAPPAVLPE